MNLNIEILLAPQKNIHVLLPHTKSFKEKKYLKKKDHGKKGVTPPGDTWSHVGVGWVVTAFPPFLVTNSFNLL